MVIPINDETIAEVPNTSCCEERHKANEKFHGFVCECPCHQSKPCCERPRKTVSVSTLKGRRAICNNCGADWPQSSHSKGETSLKQPHQFAKSTIHREECVCGLLRESPLHVEAKGESWDKAKTEALVAANVGLERTNRVANIMAHISKLLSDREKEIRRKCDTVRERAPSTKKMFDRGFAAGAEAERAKIAEQFLQAKMDLPLLYDFKEWLIPNPPTE